MASAFPDDDDGPPRRDNSGHRLRIFYDDDDGDQNTQDKPFSRGRGNPRRGRGRSRGRGRGDGRPDDTRYVDRGADDATSRPSRGSYRGGRNMRGRNIRDRSASSRQHYTENQDTEDRSNSVDRRANRGNGESSDRYRDTRDGQGREDLGPRVSEPQKITESKLKYLARTSPEEADKLLLEIANTKSGFPKLLDSDIEPQLVYYVLKILSIAITSSQKRVLIDLLSIVQHKFLSRLSAVLGEVSARTPSHRNIWANSKSLSNNCILILQILKELVQTINDALGKSKNVMINIKQIVTDFSLIQVNEDLEAHILAVDELFRAVVEEREKQVQQHTSRRQRYMPKEEEEGLPPENFRELSVLPRLRDVHMDEKPFLRANRAKGKYDDLDTYLDIQFRLLREDFIQPLRLGIAEYIQSLSDTGGGKKLRDIRLYRHVQIVRPVCTPDGISYIIQFDTTALKWVNWATTQRLKYGSLLCLSNDNFQTISYATVKDRSIADLGEGLVQVHFETMPCTESSETFLMAESTAYFEAFRHILEGLQTVDTTLPFQRYLLECNTAIKPPKYLLKAGVPLYDFRPILSPNTKSSLFAEVPVLNTLRWPKADDLQLDKSQYDALQLAITKELAIIQGPPGTGKTFIGLRIAEVLIENKSHWKPEKKGSPVLVVCYTNHALDQFLEGILKFCKTGIVRVGGRCSNDALKNCILRNLKREKSKERSRSWGILQNERDCLREMSECQRNIHSISAELKKTFTEIISFNRLKDYMTFEQQDSFENEMPDDERNYIANWLGFHSAQEHPGESDGPNTQSDKSKAKHLWIQHVLKHVDEMPASETTDISDPTDPSISLQDRAKLFKSWNLEFIQEVEKMKSSSEDSMLKQLTRLLSRSESEIIHPNIMLPYLKTSHATSQVLALLRATVFEKWLAIDGKPESAALIQSVIESLVSDKDDGKDGMADERELDSDEDDMLFDYTDEDIKGKKHRDNVSGETEGDWLVKWNAKIERGKVQHMLRSASDISDAQANRTFNVKRVNMDHRRNMYRHWIKRYREKLKESVLASSDRFSELTEKLKEVREAETIQIMQEAQVIGMTTTGAAKHRKSLQKVKPSIVIVEEAAEVLESHIVTALSEGCNHLILIGDHKQLRPSTTVYELATKYQLDISLFERMIRNNIPCVTLSEQHRMRPEISVMMKNEFLYPDLQDHVMVLNYEHIKGVDSDVYFIEHNVAERKLPESTSYQNPHEAKFLSGLCKYLLQQGYDRSQITILSPYMGQVSLLRKVMPKSEFDGVRITAVDNFQGEENDIILLSLVRSQPEDVLLMKKNPIGFLAIDNRICVALSRAKMGFYIVGNFSHIKAYSRLWQHIVGKMENSRRIGKEITLRCQNHPDKACKVSTADDFKQAPDGGCKEPCGGRLKCGHFCPRVCHILDKEHEHVKCLKPCPKVFPKCGHNCKNKCWENCGKCETKVTKKLPMCEHSAEMPCHKDPHTWKCREKCSFILPCGHECSRDCHKCIESKSHEDKCKVKVDRELACSHTVKMNCFQDPSKYKCSSPCKTVLTCGHPCTGSCGMCLRGKIHRICQNTCEKTLPCGHNCRAKCSDLCPPCELPCQWTCSHSRRKCKNKCREECEPCAEDCLNKCPHSKCTKRCHEICDKEPCDEKCTQELKCGHACSSLCGEPCVCSEFCSVKNNKYNSVYEKGTVYVKLSSCGCIIPQSLLDPHMQQASGARGELIKRCPDCNKPVGGTNLRYLNILKQNRRNVVNKFASIVGTESERTTRSQELQADIEILGLMGFPESGQKFLINQLKPEIFGSLHMVGKSVELLKELLNVQKKLKMFVDVPATLEPSKLVDVILTRRRYTTAQYWDEINTEIKRMKYYVQLEVQKRMIVSGTDKEQLYLKCRQILAEDAPLTSKRREVVEQVIEHLKS